MMDGWSPTENFHIVSRVAYDFQKEFGAINSDTFICCLENRKNRPDVGCWFWFHEFQKHLYSNSEQ